MKASLNMSKSYRHLSTKQVREWFGLDVEWIAGAGWCGPDWQKAVAIRLEGTFGLYDYERAMWAKSGGKPLRLWTIDRAKEAMDQWNNAGGHLGAHWKLRPIDDLGV